MRVLALVFIAALFAPFLKSDLPVPSERQTGDLESRVKNLEKIVQEQQVIIEQQQREIESLKTTISISKSEEPPKEDVSKKGSGGLFGGSALTNPNISLILNTFAFKSNLNQEELDSMRIRGFTGTYRGVQNGFNLDSAELYMYAPVDPYFNFYATIPFTRNGAEVEEAYFITTSLPGGLQIKSGRFRSGFGRFNGQHTHSWDFADAPLPYVAFAGNDGIDENGFQVTYLPPLPIYTLFGFEMLQGENEQLGGSGRRLYSGFVKSSVDTGEKSTVLFGLSYLYGRSRKWNYDEDSEFEGAERLYGAEFTYKWKESKLKGFVLQGEYLFRNEGGNLFDNNNMYGILKKNQDGFYLQGVYQLGRIRFGLRYDALGILKNSYHPVGYQMPWRATGVFEFNPTEFSRIRFQYCRDRSAQYIDNEAILQFIMGIGAHAAHPF